MGTYDMTLRALRSKFPITGEKNIADPTTAIANADGTLSIIPLDILSNYVNLKKMWNTASFPVAIVFRELMDDWYALFPLDPMFSTWRLTAMPGADHNMHRAKYLAEAALRGDFGAATVKVAAS